MEYGAVSKALHTAQARLAQDNSPAHRALWRAAKNSFDLWAEAQGRMHQSFLDLRYHMFGNKPGKLLARLCKGPHTPSHITTLKDNSGNLTSSPKNVNLILEKFDAT